MSISGAFTKCLDLRLESLQCLGRVSMYSSRPAHTCLNCFHTTESAAIDPGRHSTEHLQQNRLTSRSIPQVPLTCNRQGSGISLPTQPSLLASGSSEQSFYPQVAARQVLDITAVIQISLPVDQHGAPGAAQGLGREGGVVLSLTLG